MSVRIKSIKEKKPNSIYREVPSAPHTKYPKCMYHEDFHPKTIDVKSDLEHQEARQKGWVETPALFLDPESNAAKRAIEKFGYPVKMKKEKEAAEFDDEVDEVLSSLRKKKAKKTRKRATRTVKEDL